MPEDIFTVPSFAKINWFLHVLGKRADGFHELCTAFQTVSLHDNLTFSANDEILLTCDDERIPTDDRNLIVRAALVLQEKYSVKTGVRIHLVKKIPAPGGLGGGSSNAAIAMLGLLSLWKIKIGFDDLVKIGGQLGSDVPFFFYGGTALGFGRGTEISSLKDLRERFVLIVTPMVDVSTKEAFTHLKATRLTNETSKSILQICQTEAENLDLRQTILKNDFEESVFAVEPEIERVKDKLIKLGALKAQMSGSGASVFAVFENEETRQTAQKAIAEEEKNWREFAVATVSRSEYREALEEVFKVVSD
jgi:4-diphosphocytidyl-2-C-methyl-D-erythritol kinase